MDTNSPGSVAPLAGRGPYRHHSHEFKRAVVEETFQPGAASVAQIARHHGINANQVFKWRQAFRDGSLEGETPTLLPVQVVHGSMAAPSVAVRDSCSTGSVLIVEATRGRLHIEGQPHVDTLRVVLEQLLR